MAGTHFLSGRPIGGLDRVSKPRHIDRTCTAKNACRRYSIMPVISLVVIANGDECVTTAKVPGQKTSFQCASPPGATVNQFRITKVQYGRAFSCPGRRSPTNAMTVAMEPDHVRPK